MATVVAVRNTVSFAVVATTANATASDSQPVSGAPDRPREVRALTEVGSSAGTSAPRDSLDDTAGLVTPAQPLYDRADPRAG
ncbi:hypothetical protein GCM10010399_14590 [Dactylosporangium fulvum]